MNLIILLTALILLAWFLKKYSLNNNKFIIVLVILLLLNIALASKLMEFKSSMNTSTIMSYHLVRDAFTKIEYSNKMENVEDINKLAGIIREINKNLAIFEHNLKYSKLTDNNERFHLLIDRLKNSLNAFMIQHNKYFATSNTATPQKLAKYEKLKVELAMFEYYLSKLGTRGYSVFGIQMYRIGLLGHEKYDWYSKLEERVLNIEKIVDN